MADSNTAIPYTVVVTQERVKTITVGAENEGEAEVRVREMLAGDYGGWRYKYPKVVVLNGSLESG